MFTRRPDTEPDFDSQKDSQFLLAVKRESSLPRWPFCRCSRIRTIAVRVCAFAFFGDSLGEIGQVIQQHLFDNATFAAIEKSLRAPISAKADPSTSREAAAKITHSGKREGQQLAALALVRKYPGCTSLELARKGGTMDRYVLARRLPEIERGGLVYQSTPKVCGISGHKAVTWWPR